MAAKVPTVPPVPTVVQEQAKVPTPTDWDGLLRDFLSSDAHAARTAADAFCGVIQGTLRALGAYQRRSSWEDLMHDVLLALFEHGHAVEKPAAWLRRATLNAYVDWLRKESSQLARVRAFGQVQSLRTHPEVDGVLDASVLLKQELEELRGAVSRLPEGLRRIVDCVYPRDPGRELATLADVARTLNLELHTVKNGLRSAIERLGRELRRERNLRRFRKADAPRSRIRFGLRRSPAIEREPRMEE